MLPDAETRAEHTLTHIHTYTQTCIYTHTHTQTDTCTLRHTHSLSHIHTLTHTQTWLNANLSGLRPTLLPQNHVDEHTQRANLFFVYFSFSLDRHRQWISVGFIKNSILYKKVLEIKIPYGSSRCVYTHTNKLWEQRQSFKDRFMCFIAF